MFTTGDKVVHPGHGPGVVRGIESRRLLGEEKQYYVIEMLASSATLMTPVARADEVGLRPAINDVSLRCLFELLADEPATLSDDFRERQTNIEERLKDGDVFATARVIRDLMWYAQVQGLTKRDMQLMQRAEELVAAELALVEDIEVKTALDRVQGIVEAAISEGEVEPTG
jgi:CarD family transcriptional regulator